MRNKTVLVIALLSLLVIMALSACDTASNGSHEPITIEGVEMIPLEMITDNSAITCTLAENQLVFKEGELEVTLLLDSIFIYRDGYISDSLPAAPVARDGVIYLPEALLSDYWSGADKDDLSLYYSAMYFPAEVAAALDAPDSEHSQKLLAAISLPRSMGITVPKLDPNRIMTMTPLSEYPPELAAEIQQHGYDDAADYVYSEYKVIAETQTLEAAGMASSIKDWYPELASTDTSQWTLKDYNLWQREQLQAQRNAMYTDEEKELMRVKGILIEDMFFLRKEFHSNVLEQPDEVLKETLEQYYQLTIDMYGIEGAKPDAPSLPEGPPILYAQPDVATL